MSLHKASLSTNQLLICVDPIEEVHDTGEDAWLALAATASPGHDADNVELTGFGLGWADKGAARVTHAGRIFIGTESDHAGPNHIGPTGFQIGVGPNIALELLKLVGHFSRWFDKTPAGKPTTSGATVVLSCTGHASWADVRSRDVGVGGEFDQSDVVLNGVRSVESRVDDDLGNCDIFFGGISVLLAPFSNADPEFGRALALPEAVGGAEDPAGSDQGSSANVLSFKEGVRGVSEGDLPGELSVAGGESVDDTAIITLQAALLEGNGARHDGGQHDQEFHLRRWKGRKLLR